MQWYYETIQYVRKQTTKALIASTLSSMVDPDHKRLQKVNVAITTSGYVRNEMNAIEKTCSKEAFPKNEERETTRVQRKESSAEGVEGRPQETAKWNSASARGVRRWRR